MRLKDAAFAQEHKTYSPHHIALASQDIAGIFNHTALTSNSVFVTGTVVNSKRTSPSSMQTCVCRTSWPQYHLTVRVERYAKK